MEITVAGKKVTVDDSFRSLSPEQQNATVDEIYEAMNGRPVIQDGAQIGAVNSNPGDPLRITVDASPEPAQGNWMDGAARFGQSALSSATGALQGVTMGAYDEISSVLGTPIKAVERLATGQDSINGLGDLADFTGRSYNASRAGQQSLTEQAYEQAPAAFIAGDLAGSMLLGGGMASQGGSLLGRAVRPTIAGMAGRGALEGATTGFGTGFNTAQTDELIDRLSSGVGGGVAGALLGGATGGLFGGIAARQQNATVPTSQSLINSAGDLYTQARASEIAPSTFGAPPANTKLNTRPGPVTQAVRDGQIPAAPILGPVRQAEFGTLVDKLTNAARSRNVITPKGNINSTYSSLGGPLSLLAEYKDAGRPVTIDELLTLRTNIRDAAADPEQKVASIGMQMFDEFNDYLYKIAPEIEQADNLYWRGKTGELIDKMSQLATVRSGQYSQSGMENGLRAEARLISRQIINGRIKGLPPDLATQINKLAEGDDIQDFARWVSKFGVQNPITSLTGVGAGLATGSLVPALGIWGTAQGAGAVARALAFEKYNAASAIARNGGGLPEASIPSIAAALVQTSGQQGANVPGAVSQALYGNPREQ